MAGDSRGVVLIPKLALSLLLIAVLQHATAAQQQVGGALQMYVDALPQLPRLAGFSTAEHGGAKPRRLTIGMFQKKWKFHRDLPASTVFVYGTSAKNATFPGPVIEARQGIPLRVTWKNHLPRNHILPWDPTVPTAIPKSGGVPAVVHLHGGIHEPQSDGSALAWFTAKYLDKGPAWSVTTYRYPNVQHPGNLWYHDHALGLTRVNLLAGLLGPYIISNPHIEGHFKLPSGQDYDRHLVIADRSFNADGSIYMNRTGNNPTIHPQWKPEYFGDAITVNGKAWPFLNVERRRYRFRILNASNARYLRLALSCGLGFTVVGSDASYLRAPVKTQTLLVSPAEIFDVVVDFSAAIASDCELTNDAPYPFPTGATAALPNSRVMKFVIGRTAPRHADKSRVPASLVKYPAASAAEASITRYVVMYEYMSATGQPTHIYINGKRFEDPVTETPKAGSTEVWEVINLTGDNHPLHIHLGEFQAIKVRRLVNLTDFQKCMGKRNDAVKCNIAAHATGTLLTVPAYEKTWKNVVKIEPGCMTTVVVKFVLIETNRTYPFDVTAEPGYVYHCHILDHEDNAMIRPFKLVA